MTIAIITHPKCLLHDMGPQHPESPERLIAIFDSLKYSKIKDSLEFIDSIPATQEQLLLVHDKNHVDFIFKHAPHKGYYIIDPDTIMNPFTLEASLLAAGSGILAVDKVMQKKVNQAFCLVRPPGHHAERHQAMGFCFFNNCALAVQYTLNQYHFKKIAIIDFDVHHGNGTEDIFKNEARVMLCSSFEYPFYPHTSLIEPGSEASNHILHMPLKANTTGTTVYQQIVEQWIPKLKQFGPEVLFFSAGFDAHEKDPLADLKFTTSDYKKITEIIFQETKDTTKGRVISFLEGGYAVQILGESVLAHLEGLLNEELEH